MSRKKVDSWLVTAVAAHKQGDLHAAMDWYKKILDVDPRNADALHLSGLVEYQSGNLAQAMVLVNRAIKINSRSAIFWNTLGLILRASGNTVEAIKSYKRAVNLEPRDSEYWLNMGVAWHFLGESDQAAECYRKSLEINPQYVNALKNLGQLLSDNKLHADASSVYETVLKITPDDKESLAFLAFSNQHICYWNDIYTKHAQINQFIENGVDAFVSPFAQLSMSNSPDTQKRCSEAWSRRFMPPIEKLARPNTDYIERADGKICVAYWSSDLQEHATSYLLADVIGCHDKETFEIILLSYGKDNGGIMRERLIAHAADFIDIRENSYEEVAQLIRERGVGILVDLKGYTSNSRTPMLALHAAPIQVNWLGYPGTLGTPHADYLIADDFVIPNGMEQFYSEKIVRLPHCYQPNDRQRAIGETLSRQAYGLPETGFVFCSFNQAYKILPEMFDTWMRILVRVPDSVLWLLSAGPEMEENLRREAKQRQVLPERLIFADHAPLDQHLARYRIANLALDTFPVGSHTTASDALWAGCPLISMAGQTFASRVSGSVLRAAGLPELITETFESFEALAVRLAQEPLMLQVLKQRLADTRDTAPLFDTPQFTRNLETAYLGMLAEKRR